MGADEGGEGVGPAEAAADGEELESAKATLKQSRYPIRWCCSLSCSMYEQEVSSNGGGGSQGSSMQRPTHGFPSAMSLVTQLARPLSLQLDGMTPCSATASD